MSEQCPTIYLGSILLEPNRWSEKREPSYRVSEWIDRIRDAGFAGIELWENHYYMADETERAALESASSFIEIFNNYTGFSEEFGESRRMASDAVRKLQTGGTKFNIGNNDEDWGLYVKTVNDWGLQLPEGTRVLCECHPNTLVETPEGAAKAFSEWGDSRFQAIVHPFNSTEESLKTWFEALGSRITHLHMQMRSAENFEMLSRIEDRAEKAKNTIKIMKDYGFSGTITIEFTKGTRTENDTPEYLFENACADLAFIRENW
jgi:sugar phosphate isomerase/epimerase